jgi:hypothetical protein
VLQLGKASELDAQINTQKTPVQKLLLNYCKAGLYKLNAVYP